MLPRWHSDKEFACQRRRHRRCRFDRWVGKIPWSRKWQPTPVFLPGEFHGQRSPAGYSPRGHKELDTTEHTSLTSLSSRCPCCYWVVTATVSLADKAGDTCCVCNLCMHLQLFLDLPFVSRLSWTSSFCSRQLSFITTWIPLTSCSCLSITSRADSDCPGSLHPPPTVTDITVRCQRSVMVVLA